MQIVQESSPIPSDRGLLSDLRSSGSFRLAPLRSSEMEDMDLQIILFLQDDGRTPFTAIARELNTSEKLVSWRVEVLRKTFALDLTVVGDPRALGYPRGAMLGISLPMQKIEPSLIDQVGEVSGVSHVALSTGRFDMMVEVFFGQADELLKICGAISERTGPNSSVEILPYIEVHYQQSNWRQTFRKASGEAPPVVSSPLQLNPVDRNIIRLLSLDGRKSFRSIGTDLGISEGQVRQRYKRLYDRGVIKVQGLVHPATLGYDAVAWVGVKSLSRPVAEFVKDAKRVEGVTYAASCFGRFDVLLEVVAKDERALLKIIDHELGLASGDSKTETFLTLGLYYKRVEPPKPASEN